jgi:hypothetical protein
LTARRWAEGLDQGEVLEQIHAGVLSRLRLRLRLQGIGGVVYGAVIPEAEDDHGALPLRKCPDGLRLQEWIAISLRYVM